MPSNQTQNDQTAKDSQMVASQLYDALMKQIEPELVSDQVDYLGFYYAGETDEERAVRMERYAKATMLFEDRLNQLLGAWDKEVRTYRDALMAKLKEKNTAEETETMSSLDRAITES